jgi:hypothetical protein
MLDPPCAFTRLREPPGRRQTHCRHALPWLTARRATLHAYHPSGDEVNQHSRPPPEHLASDSRSASVPAGRSFRPDGRKGRANQFLDVRAALRIAYR